MESMKWQSQPLPCEVSDIGHAVFDGADGLLLGAATSIGINPVEVSSAHHAPTLLPYTHACCASNVVVLMLMRMFNYSSIASYVTS